MAYRGPGDPYGRAGYDGHPMQDLNAQNPVSIPSAAASKLARTLPRLTRGAHSTSVMRRHNLPS